MPTARRLHGYAPARGQDHRFRQLASDDRYAAVAATALPDGTLSLVARNAAGAIAHAEVLDADGRPLLPDEALRVLTAARQTAQSALDQATDGILAHLGLREALGGELNLSAIARDAGVARQTLYNRLQDLDVKPAPQTQALAAVEPATAKGKGKSK